MKIETERHLTDKMETTIPTFIDDYSINEFKHLLSAFISHDDYFFVFFPFFNEFNDYETIDIAYEAIEDDFETFTDKDENRKAFVKSQIEILMVLYKNENIREKLTKFIWAIMNDVLRPLYEEYSKEDEDLPIFDEILCASDLAMFSSNQVRNEALRIVINF
jgi:hypothetical protein